MKLKEEKALAGIDMVLAIMVIIIFSALILTLITNNALENLKTAKESETIIYLTEILENIGIEKYDNITEENIINNLIPEEVKVKYQVEVNVQEEFSEISDKDKIIKKIDIKLIYEIADKKYECYMERLKVKE